MKDIIERWKTSANELAASVGAPEIFDETAVVVLDETDIVSYMIGGVCIVEFNNNVSPQVEVFLHFNKNVFELMSVDQLTALVNILSRVNVDGTNSPLLSVQFEYDTETGEIGFLFPNEITL